MVACFDGPYATGDGWNATTDRGPAADGGRDIFADPFLDAPDRRAVRDGVAVVAGDGEALAVALRRRPAAAEGGHAESGGEKGPAVGVHDASGLASGWRSLAPFAPARSPVMRVARR